MDQLPGFSNGIPSPPMLPGMGNLPGAQGFGNALAGMGNSLLGGKGGGNYGPGGQQAWINSQVGQGTPEMQQQFGHRTGMNGPPQGGRPPWMA